MDFRNRIYNSYGKFKGWENISLSDEYFDMYEGELRQHQIQMPGTLLEIGFGSGHFLKWAKSKGFQVVGVEVNSEFVERARQEGLEVYHLALQQIEQLNSSVKKFNTIVLFDILEHLYPEEILNLFDKLLGILEDNGRILCRFPNGISPFFSQTQWADMTHVTVLTPERMRQVGMATGFEVVHFCNAYRSLKVGKRAQWIKRLLYQLRNAYEYLIGFFYFGGRVPLDPNLSLSLKKLK